MDSGNVKVKKTDSVLDFMGISKPQVAVPLLPTGQESPFYLKYVLIINLRYVYLGLPGWLNGVSPLHRSCAMQLPVKVL